MPLTFGVPGKGAVQTLLGLRCFRYCLLFMSDCDLVAVVGLAAVVGDGQLLTMCLSLEECCPLLPVPVPRSPLWLFVGSR